MASVFREDTGERLGYIFNLYGPLEAGTKSWRVSAWRHSDGVVRFGPEIPLNGKLTPALRPNVHFDIPVSNIEATDVHVSVPPELLNLILSYPAFRSTPA